MLVEMLDTNNSHQAGAVPRRGAASNSLGSKGYTFLAVCAKRTLRMWRALLLGCCFVVTPGALAQGGADDAAAKSIVEKADEVRFPREGFEVIVSIASSLADGVTESRKYRILSKGNQNTIVMALEPASERGQAMLMKTRDLWIFMPSISQPVRLSLSQRLTGQVANGDLARANFTGDYVPRLLRTETVDGEAMHVLELTAVDRSVTYHRVVYWVRQAGNRPYKAEFYSLSDRLLKTCLYQDYRQLAGRVRPGRLVMEDALHKGETSVLEYRDMRMRDLPDKMFTKDYLKHLD
jgi:outer membrane lipoprotein-sorting protein